MSIFVNKYHVYYTKLDNNGGVLTSNTQLTTQDAGMTVPDLAVDQNDAAHLIWGDGREAALPFPPLPWKAYHIKRCPDADPDADGDCWTSAYDCDDNNPDINPGATEICDGVDNNCDYNIDENLTRPTTCGVGECSGNTGQLECQGGSEVDTCDPLAGATSDDNCDGLDNDCDGTIDEGCQTCNETINVSLFKIDCSKEKIVIRATSNTQPDAQPLTFIIYDGSGVQQFPSSGAESMSWKANKNRYQYNKSNIGSFLSSWDDNYYVIVYSQDCAMAESSQHLVDQRKNCP